MVRQAMTWTAQSSYAYPPVTEALLSEIVRRICSVGTPAKIVLFGSRARGDNKPDSDIDILVLERLPGDLREKGLRYDLAIQDLFPERTVLVYSLRDAEEWKYVPNFVLSEALRQGKVLYEDPSTVMSGPSSGELSLAVAEDTLEYKTPSDLARDWFDKGNEDLLACFGLLNQDICYPLVCFHAQQAVEKYLKGLLALHGRTIKKTHSLEALLQELGEVLPVCELLDSTVNDLSRYAIEARYDLKFTSSRAAAQDALDVASRAIDSLRTYIP